MEGALERGYGVPASRLARVFESCLHRLGAGVAEEGLRPAEPRGKPVRKVGHGLGPVEVGDVPEPVELTVRRRDDVGVPVPEADDRDAAGKVEVRRAVVCREARAVAFHEGDAEARVGREDR